MTNIPPNFKWPIGPPRGLAAVPVVTPHAPAPPEFEGQPRNLARFLIGYENAVNTANSIHTEYTTGTPVRVARPARDEPTD
jgi:hypothetical protein